MSRAYIKFYDGALFSLCEFCKFKEQCKEGHGEKVVECKDFRNERDKDK